MRLERTGPPVGWLLSGVLPDLAIAILCAAVLYRGLTEAGYPSLLCLLLAVPAALPALLWRRHDSSTILGAVLVVPAVAATVSGSVVTWLFLPVTCALYRVAALNRPRTSAAMLGAVVAVLATGGLAGWLRDRPANGDTVSIIMMVVIAWGIGRLVRQQRASAAQQRIQAAVEERLRIAREMHDVLAHNMSVIAVQASFGHYVIGSRPDEAAGALRLIETISREALDEIRGLLGVLRQDEPGERDPAPRPDDGGSAAGPVPEAPLRPAPDLAELDRLLTRSADAGVDAVLEVRGRTRKLPPGIELSTYRIVQEALTNVAKHSPVARCKVVLEYRHDELLIDVIDDGPIHPTTASARQRTVAGHGLIGMCERVALHRGRFTAGPRPEGGFRVTARIPLRGGP